MADIPNDAGHHQAADGWREWLRIFNALSLREQPTIITAVTEASVQGVPDQAKHGTVRDDGVDLPPEWQAARDLAMSGAERIFIEGFARHAARDAAASVARPVVGHEEDGLPIDFAWPDERIAVFLDEPDPDTRRDLESARWRVFTGDPDTVYAALREAA